MLTTHELLETKARMLLAAEAAHQIVNKDEPLELDEQTFDLVTSALLALRSDCRALLAEVDILRGMVTGSFDSLFSQEVEHGRSANVAGVQHEEAAGSGDGERADATSPSGPVRSGGADGEEGGGPKPKRNRRRRKVDQEQVES